eukprot:m.34102 g.34102  ORF g.34102 m.34102 type:complete len:113 (+) comp11104_c0_seq1:47-385(+)
MEVLTHSQRVLRLYRLALQHSRSWAIERPLWRAEALKLRARFDANKNASVKQAAKLLEDGEAEFFMKKHPDPYKPCVALDGSKWERNVPPPPEVVHTRPDEQEWLSNHAYWR